MRRSAIFVIVIGSIILFSCKKKDEYPETPELKFVSISESTVEEFNNNVRITIQYEDYQGDLGEVDPDTYSLRIKDSRLSDYDWFHLPPMTPDMQELHIKGTYTIELDPLFMIGNGTEEQTLFSIEIRDRSGNWSNMVRTPNVLIVDSL